MSPDRLKAKITEAVLPIFYIKYGFQNNGNKSAVKCD